MDLPSAGLNQTPSGSTCTHKKTTHTKDIYGLQPLLASAAGSGLYSAADVFKQVILMGKTKQMLSQGRGKPAAMATFNNNVTNRVSTETSFVIQPSSPPQHMCPLYSLPFASLPCWHWKSLLGLQGSLLVSALGGGL